ncbi:unnamed protein product [Arctia plantaginis]|uniref:Uncharacterized protein n=1 Tax=Arctia plantaginis TaxID=874455 RepID=A0A8S1A039_ARCPL|nr:unnamed protein product [Arctia plantaginis]
MIIVRWYGHVMRRPSDPMTRKVLDIEIKPRGRGRPGITWMPVVNNNLKEVQANKYTIQDRAAWRHMIRRADPKQNGKGPGKEEV